MKNNNNSSLKGTNKMNENKNNNDNGWNCNCEKCGGTAPAVLHTEKPKTEFKNYVGDGPSGFDYWHDTKWSC